MSEILAVKALDVTVLVVAVKGGANDWSAYVKGVPGHNHSIEKHEVARTGNKIDHRIANLLFPWIEEDLKLRWGD